MIMKKKKLEKLYEYKPHWSRDATAIPAKNLKDFWDKMSEIYPQTEGNPKKYINLYGLVPDYRHPDRD